MSAAAPNYKDTLTLPQTTFPMRGDLVKNEPKRLERWENDGLYEKIIARRRSQNAPEFILHDGPPFANGDVHMGTALNKVLKDLVVKSKTMAGFTAPFIPGWDCHGLPIEFKVVKEAAGLEPGEIRRRCTEFASKFIDIQRASFRRLGVFGDWQNPYLTMNPGYEADILRVFAKLVEGGCVYQSKKPVQWSYGAQTALAEAEVEYHDKQSPAIFVKFPLQAGEAVSPALADASMVIWTTTPWTLPSNLGIALHPEFTYIIGKFLKDDQVETLVIVPELVELFAEKTGFALAETLGEIKGREFEGLLAQHPFLERTSKLILANFVTTDAGTGAVHIAPGHGADDYVAGQQNGLGVLSPVDDEGNYTDEVGMPELVGRHVFKSNERIIEILTDKGMLLGQEVYSHSYPYCWRSKTPIIFRAVEQFFISLETLRGQALTEIDKVEWLPAWGRNRIYGTVESRPDWCISRQRTWGVPLPVFFDQDNKAILSAELACKIADLVEKEGTNLWFEKSDAELAALLGLPEGVKKCRDTLDVWIDSGCSHVAVLEQNSQLHAPADLYLEATDQHRGWFQSSLMLSTAYRGSAPYKSVMTHGFVVDKDKKKLSKSEAEKAGKPIDAAHFYNQYGADIVRLWVSSVDWQNEVPFGEELFKQVAEPYRRLRNTLRILLGNLDGFDPATAPAEPAYTLLDRWILERLHEVVAECRKAYETYEFRKVFNSLNQFCTADLSAIYIDALKDRMYCDAPSSPRRIASQAAMHEVFVALSKLLAPILAYTADEAWEHATFTEGTIHEQDFPEPNPKFAPGDAIQKVERLFEIKSAIQTAIESQIQAKAFTRNNEADVTLTIPADEPLLDLLNDRDFATEFFIVAELKTVAGDELSATARKTELQLCPRCRKHEPLLESGLCERCDDVISGRVVA
ncbi:isoleucine--tRNA ligase [Luteolibacter pohnpeiensis]|uniref:Isoleucine--tRNA ligase n=1 Tax=Luteolibacter pohnpeiensis TaxID=454153 RepID=A0A934SD67_9BACT|nr:isoleucine--tRNA ligase [Luteolibacter pohnpeiensis]MBK1883083.1 isoleucine--tRNA ligase [Luteolibacter pohnpeiensis]